MLSALWGLVHTGRARPLNFSELLQLRRICDRLVATAQGTEGYADQAEELTLSIHSSGVFEAGVLKGADELLEEIDNLRDSLPSDGGSGK